MVFLTPSKYIRLQSGRVKRESQKRLKIYFQEKRVFLFRFFFAYAILIDGKGESAMAAAYFLLGVLSIIVAMFANYAGPKFYASSFGSKFQDNYAMRTIGTGLVIFVGIILATVLIEAVGKDVRLENPAK